jgi:hypothetical protein
MPGRGAGTTLLASPLARQDKAPSAYPISLLVARVQRPRRRSTPSISL